MARKVFIFPLIEPYLKDYLLAKGYDVKVAKEETYDDIMANCSDCDAIIAGLGTFDAKVLDHLPKLKVLAKLGVGVDNFDLKRAEELGIWCVNAPYSNALSVAEFTITAICNLAKNYPVMVESMRDGVWQARKADYFGCEMDGKVLGLIGAGRIGSIVAKKAYHGLGMKVIGYDKYANSANIPPEIKLRSSLEEVLRESDFISLHTPLNDETRGMMNEARFAMMKPTAFFINMARGAVADEKALYRACRDKVIAGAAIDVYEVEPPIPDDPIFSLKNVYATPHTAVATDGAFVKMSMDAAQGVIEVLSGKKPTWHVNKPTNPRTL
ncbi:MAG: hydroxyacid dehydrogenase [Oscillospiraceae bacterium]